MFIVLEGVDGSGKSTQAKNIVEYIRKNYPTRSIVLTREPGGTFMQVSESIREVLLKNDMDDYTRALLYAASRYEHQLQIKKWIENGFIVICDRYIYSSLAYQSNEELSMEEIMQINRYNDIIKPDHILFFRTNINTYRKRKNLRSKTRELDAIEIKPDEFFLKVITNYGKALEYEWSKIIEIDANKSIEEVTSNTLNIINDLLREENK